MRKPCPCCNGSGVVGGDWRLTWGDISFTGDDLKVSDYAAAAAINGLGWSAADADQGPHIASNLIPVVVARLTDRNFMEVAAEVGTAPAETILRALSFDKVEDAKPKKKKG